MSARINKKVKQAIEETVKIINYKEGTVSIEYMIDDIRKIKLGLTANINSTITPEELHQIMYIKLLESLNNIIEITMVEDVEEIDGKE